MKARRESGETGFRLFEGEREIGFIRDGRVGFTGFVSAADAAYAGRVAHLALAIRRGTETPWTPSLPADHVLVMEGGREHVVARSGILATLLPPVAGLAGVEDWGVELQLLPQEQYDILAIARARAMWTGMLGSGVAGRMRQFNEAAPMTA